MGFEDFGVGMFFEFTPLWYPWRKIFTSSAGVDELWKIPLTACRYLLPVRSYVDLKFLEKCQILTPCRKFITSQKLTNFGTVVEGPYVCKMQKNMNGKFT